MHRSRSSHPPMGCGCMLISALLAVGVVALAVQLGQAPSRQAAPIRLTPASPLPTVSVPTLTPAPITTDAPSVQPTADVVGNPLATDPPFTPAPTNIPAPPTSSDGT